MSGVLAINQYMSLDLFYGFRSVNDVKCCSAVSCVDLAIEEDVEKEMGDEIDEIDKRMQRRSWRIMSSSINTKSSTTCNLVYLSQYYEFHANERQNDYLVGTS